MKDKITIPIDELRPENDAGHHAWITCPDCGEGVHIAENPYWETRCQCREWSLVIVAVGRPLDDDESEQLCQNPMDLTIDEPIIYCEKCNRHHNNLPAQAKPRR